MGRRKSGRNRGSGGDGKEDVITSSGVPETEKELVQSLKEVVNCSDKEIYAMLVECNMDPDEAVSRLLSEGDFHEVKRKRDKKKEAKDTTELPSEEAGSIENPEPTCSDENKLNANELSSLEEKPTKNRYDHAGGSVASSRVNQPRPRPRPSRALSRYPVAWLPGQKTIAEIVKMSGQIDQNTAPSTAESDQMATRGHPDDHDNKREASREEDRPDRSQPERFPQILSVDDFHKTMASDLPYSAFSSRSRLSNLSLLTQTLRAASISPDQTAQQTAPGPVRAATFTHPHAHQTTPRYGNTPSYPRLSQSYPPPMLPQFKRSHLPPPHALSSPGSGNVFSSQQNESMPAWVQGQNPRVVSTSRPMSAYYNFPPGFRQPQQQQPPPQPVRSFGAQEYLRPCQSQAGMSMEHRPQNPRDTSLDQFYAAYAQQLWQNKYGS